MLYFKNITLRGDVHLSPCLKINACDIPPLVLLFCFAGCLLGGHSECRRTQTLVHVNLTLLFCLETHSRFVLVTCQTCPTARYVPYPFLLNQLSPVLLAVTWLSVHEVSSWLLSHSLAGRVLMDAVRNPVLNPSCLRGLWPISAKWVRWHLGFWALKPGFSQPQKPKHLCISLS